MVIELAKCTLSLGGSGEVDKGVADGSVRLRVDRDESAFTVLLCQQVCSKEKEQRLQE